MANFKTHMTIAALGSMTATAISIQKIGLNDEQAVILFMLGSIAGLLPDIDSDHSTPAKWFFRSLTAIALLTVTLYTIPRFPHLQIAIYLLTTFIFVHFILANIIQSITAHRGLFHSVPAAGLFGMGMYFLGIYGFSWSEHFSWLAAAFICGGYLLHLTLDELYSVDLLGGKLKQSFGSALTFFNGQKWVSYVSLYAILGTTIAYAWQPILF